MKTSSFFTYEGPGRISIARAAPRGVKGYRVYPAFAPRHNRLRMSYEEYRPEFFRILEALDPERVAEELAALADPYEPVLLCWEKPPLTAINFCHRAMVAEWLQRELGLKVSEI